MANGRNGNGGGNGRSKLVQFLTMPPEKLFDCTRPMVFPVKHLNCVNIVWIMRARLGGTWTPITNHLRQPLEINSPYIALIDPSQILADYVKTTAVKHKGGEHYLEDNIIEFEIVCQPETYNSSTGLLEYDAYLLSAFIGTSSGTMRCIDAATQHEQTAFEGQHEWMAFNEIHDTNPSEDDGGREWDWLSLRPSVITRCNPLPSNAYGHGGYNDYIHCAVRKQGVGLVCFARLLTQSLSNPSNTSWYYTEISDPFSITGSNGVYSVGIGTRQIMDFLGAGTWNTILSSGSRRIIAVEYCLGRYGYSADVVMLTPSYQVTEINRVNLTFGNCCDEEANSIEIIWKNRKGGIDVHSFSGEVRMIEENEFQLHETELGFRRFGSGASASNAYPNHDAEDFNHVSFAPDAFKNTFNQGSWGTGKNNITGYKRKKMYTQFMNVEAAKWCAEIATSPKVWIRDGHTAELVPVYCTIDEVEVQSKKKIVQLELSFYYSNKIVTQK